MASFQHAIGFGLQEGLNYLKICFSYIDKYILSFFLFIYLFIYLWLRWVFVAVRRLSLVVASGVCSLLRSVGSRCAGFSSCSTRAQ